jgi:hypothetical protein
MTKASIVVISKQNQLVGKYGITIAQLTEEDFENNNGTIRSYKSQILIYKCQMKELQDKKTNKHFYKEN